MKKTLLSFFIVFSQISFGISQTSDLDKDLLAWFDKKNDITSTNLINGIEVSETILAYKDSHKYFKSPYFVEGDINYLNQDYSNVLMMYNIFEDHIIIKFNEGKRTSIIQLLSNEVKSFRLHDTHFDRLRFKDENGFFELLEEYSSFKLYKKHSKYTVAKTNAGKTVRYEFVKANDVFVIQSGINYATIQSKKDIYATFPNIKSDIKSLFNKDRRMQSAWRNKEMKFIFKQIENLLHN